MADELSILFIVILAIAGTILMTLLLSCYACIFRDLCCTRQDKNLERESKVQKGIRKSQSKDNKFNQQLDTMAMTEMTQVESMQTESEKLQKYFQCNIDSMQLLPLLLLQIKILNEIGLFYNFNITIFCNKRKTSKISQHTEMHLYLHSF